MNIDNSLAEEKVQVHERSEEESESNSEDDEKVPGGKNKALKTFNQKELDGLIWNFGLPKDVDEYEAAALKKNLVNLKVLPLHNGNTFAHIPIAQSIKPEET